MGGCVSLFLFQLQKREINDKGGGERSVPVSDMT